MNRNLLRDFIAEIKSYKEEVDGFTKEHNCCTPPFDDNLVQLLKEIEEEFNKE